MYILIWYTEITEILTQNAAWRLRRRHVGSQIWNLDVALLKLIVSMVEDFTGGRRFHGVEDFTGSNISLSASHR